MQRRWSTTWTKWTDLINREYGDAPVENVIDGGVSTVDDLTNIVGTVEMTPIVSTFILLSLQNLYADIRSDKGFYAVDAAPMFDEFDEVDQNLCNIDIATTEDAVYKCRTFKNKKSVN